MRKKLILVNALIAIMLSGCGANKTENDVVNSGVTATETDAVAEYTSTAFPDYYNGTDGIVTFECEVIAPSEVRITSCKAEEIEVDNEINAQKLLENREVLSTTEYDEVELVAYNLINDGLLNYSPQGITLMEYDSRYISICLGDEDEGYNGDKFQSYVDYDFATAEDTRQELVELLRGITGQQEFEVHSFVLDADTMNEEYVTLSENPEIQNYTFTEEHNGYYFAATQSVQGLPVFSRLNGVMFTENDANAPIHAYYNKYGLRFLDVQTDELFEFEIGEDVLELKNFDEIAATVNDYYNKLVTDSTYEVYRATLYEYVSIGGKVTPVWIFKTFENKSDEYQHCVQLEINAVTGEVFTAND